MFNCFVAQLIDNSTAAPLYTEEFGRWKNQTEKAFKWFKQHQPENLKYWVSARFCHYCDIGDYSERFIQYCDQFRKIADNDSDIAMSLCNQASILRKQGKFEQAIALYKQEQKITIKLDDKKGLSQCFTNQATILHVQNKLDEAIALYERSEQLAVQLGDKLELNRCYVNKAMLLIDKRQLEKAMELLNQAHQFLMNEGNIELLALCKWNMSDIFERRLDYEQAIEFAQQATDLYKRCNIFHTDLHRQLDRQKRMLSMSLR